MLIALEFRSRLAVVNGVIRDLDQFDLIREVDHDTQAAAYPLVLRFADDVLSLTRGGESYLRVSWPKGLAEPISDTPLPFQVVPSARELVFRWPLGVAGPDVLPTTSETATPRSWSLDLTRPKCVRLDPPAESGPCQPASSPLRPFCVQCAVALGPPVAFESMWPLPSIAWRDFAQDWFCGCGDPPPGAPVDQSNRRLAGQGLVPRPACLLYAPGFVLVHPSVLKESQVENGRDLHTLYCGECDGALGLRVEGQCQLWQHSVCLAQTPPRPEGPTLSATDTFLDFVRGILSETLEATLRVDLVTPKSRLCLWVLDRQARFHTHQRDQHASANGQRIIRLTPRSGTSLLFQVTAVPEALDQSRADRIAVSDDVIEAGLNYLRHQQFLLSSMQTRDGPWEISVIAHQ